MEFLLLLKISSKIIKPEMIGWSKVAKTDWRPGCLL